MRWLGTFVMLFALAACGGGSDDADAPPDTVEPYTTTIPPEGRALADWQSASKAVCQHYDTLVQATIDRFGTLDSQEEAVEYLNAVVPVITDYIHALREVPVPTERTREVNEVIDKLNRGERSLPVVQEGAVRGSASEISSAIVRLQNYADTDELYRALGVPECASEVE